MFLLVKEHYRSSFFYTFIAQKYHMNVNFDKRDQLEGQIAGLLALADRRAIDLIYENYAETLLGLIKRMVESH